MSKPWALIINLYHINNSLTEQSKQKSWFAILSTRYFFFFWLPFPTSSLLLFYFFIFAILTQTEHFRILNFNHENQNPNWLNKPSGETLFRDYEMSRTNGKWRERARENTFPSTSLSHNFQDFSLNFYSSLHVSLHLFIHSFYVNNILWLGIYQKVLLYVKNAQSSDDYHLMRAGCFIHMQKLFHQIRGVEKKKLRQVLIESNRKEWYVEKCAKRFFTACQKLMNSSREFLFIFAHIAIHTHIKTYLYRLY